VTAALAEHPGVLALGGGAVLRPETRERLAGHPVVFLKVGLSDAVRRVGLGVGRPLLLGNVRSRIKTLLDERTPVYEAVATIVVDTDGRTADEVAADVAARIEAAEESGAASDAPPSTPLRRTDDQPCHR
jgi:shikimate kinase